MIDRVKTVLRTDGFFVAFWQRSAGRPWVPVVDPSGSTIRVLFETKESAEQAALTARQTALDKEDSNATWPSEIPPTE